MKKIKMIMAVLLLCSMGYAGYSANNYFTTPAEKLMNANVQALTRSEGGAGGRALCFSSYTHADNASLLRCVTCDYVDGIGTGKSGWCP